jgi:hypothetical protein
MVRKAQRERTGYRASKVSKAILDSKEMRVPTELKVFREMLEQPERTRL